MDLYDAGADAMTPITIMIAVLLFLTGSALGAPSPPAGAADAGALEPAAGRFLVARRGLYGPYFTRTVIYLIQHNSEGSVGVIVNRPLGKNVADVLPDMHAIELGSYPVYNGGPVNPRIMVMLFRGNYSTELALHVSDDVYASSNLAMLTQMMTTRKPGSELRMFAGQANWVPDQLAREIAQGYWYVTEGDPDALFSNDADYLWNKLINRLDPQGIIVLQHSGPADAARL